MDESKWLHSWRQKKTEEKAREIVVCYMQKKQYRPVLVGELALEIGPLWTLDDTEFLLNCMLREGSVRRATEKEKSQYCIEYDADGYFLV